MKAIIHANSRIYTIFVDQPIDISIPLRASKDNVNAWYLTPPKIYPTKLKNWTGSVKNGAAVNFNSIEGFMDGIGENRLQFTFGCINIRSKKRKHCRHVWFNHPRPLNDSTNRR